MFYLFNMFYIRKINFPATFTILCFLASPVLLKDTPTCRIGNPKDHVDERCPVQMISSTRTRKDECVAVYVWLKAEDFNKRPKLKILSPIEKTLRPTLKTQRENKTRQGEKFSCGERSIPQLPERNISLPMWVLAYDCVKANTGDIVSVFYSTKSLSCNVSYRIEGSPDFELSVNPSSKSITVAMKKKSINVTTKTESLTVTMKTEEVNVRHCYKNEWDCKDESKRRPLKIDTSQSAILNISYLLPCVCIEAYYTHSDSVRRPKCPFEKTGVMDARDVFSSSEITFYRDSFKLKTLCPARQLNISASLCWMQHKHLCTPVFNSTLEKKDGLQYDTTAVDKHPQMCVQLSVQGIRNISCPFTSDESSWEVSIGPGRQMIIVHINSFSPATFSSQFCVLTENGCTAVGKAQSVTMEENTSEKIINLPLHFFSENPCVQVWQSDPARHGRRILCPYYTHKRHGLYAVAFVIFVFVVALFGIFIHRATKRGAAGWLYIQRPLLLVCSSGQSEHISAVCALASILQEDLGATVRAPLWAQNSQSQDESGPGVADLGPLPWLYGQWDAVCKEQGKVLVIWSPEAKKTYEKWTMERANTDKSERKEEVQDCRNGHIKHEKTKGELEEDLKQKRRKLGKFKKEKAVGKKDGAELRDDKDSYRQKEASAVIEPMFTAVLARLERALQEHKNQEVVLVYFQGLGHSKDIPKTFREVRQYCLPQDFRGLTGELGEMTRRTKTVRWHCWPRVLSKVLAIWLAQKLTQRLQTLVPQTQGNKVQSTTCHQ